MLAAGLCHPKVPVTDRLAIVAEDSTHQGLCHLLAKAGRLDQLAILGIGQIADLHQHLRRDRVVAQNSRYPGPPLANDFLPHRLVGMDRQALVVECAQDIGGQFPR